MIGTHSTTEDPLAMWEREHDAAAIEEGWSIFDACSDFPELRVEALDEGDGLADDGDAWEIVMHGTGAHHVAARQLIATWSQVEWARMACHVHGWYS